MNKKIKNERETQEFLNRDDARDELVKKEEEERKDEQRNDN